MAPKKVPFLISITRKPADARSQNKLAFAIELQMSRIAIIGNCGFGVASYARHDSSDALTYLEATVNRIFNLIWADAIWYGAHNSAGRFKVSPVK